MKAAVLHGQGDIRYEDYPMPQLKAGHILIKVRAAGICGSDIPRVLGTAAHFFPIVLGHEFSGEVMEAGEGVTQFQVGDRVVAAPLVPCGVCNDCQEGSYALCKHYTFIGSRQQGGFAEYVVIPAANAVKFSSDYSFSQAALFEPAGVALHGLIQNSYLGGGTVAILGAGTIGVFTGQWAQIFGAEKVVFFDVDEERLKIATEITGGKGINLSLSNGREEAMKVTNGKGFSYVFGTSGASETINMAFSIAANKAKICFIGTPTGPVSFTAEEWELMNRHEFTVTGSWMSYSAPFPGREWTLTAEMMGQGRLKFDERFIYKKFSLAQCAEAFASFQHPGQVKGKILLVNE